MNWVEYNLPAGWQRRTIRELAGKPQYGWTTRAQSGDGVKLLRTTDISSGKVRWDTVPACEQLPSDIGKYALRPGDIVVSRAGSVGYSLLIDETCPPNTIFASYLMRIHPDPVQVAAEYLHQYMRSPYYWEQISEASVGVGLANVNGSKLGAMLVPIAPHNEQERLVCLLDKLDRHKANANTHLTKAQIAIERFRAAVLVAGCTGRLTAEWRDKHANETSHGLLEGIRQQKATILKSERKKEVVTANHDFEVPELWAKTNLDCLSLRITSGSRDWSRYYGRGSGTFVMAQNVRRGYLDWSFRQAVDPPERDASRERSQIEAGDLLVTIVGANTGDVGLVTVARPEHYVCQSVALVRPVRAELAPYLNLWFNSPVHGRGYFEDCIYGAGRPHLSFDQLRAAPVAVPSLEEQREIGRRVNQLLALADDLEHRLNRASGVVDRSAHAVLAKAFRGEFVGRV